jgi:hypothetical protein
VAAGAGGEVGRALRLRALRLLDRAAGHGAGGDHGLAQPSRPQRPGGGRAVREGPPRQVQRWLDWLQHAGLVSHTPQQDEEGFWWRTVIELHPCPQLPPGLLQDAVERRAGWPGRERRRRARGRRRDLTAILRRARLKRSERRARALRRRQLLERHAERQRVRQAVADSLAPDG